MNTHFADQEFYKEQILHAVSCLDQSDVNGIGDAVFSFFSGTKYLRGRKVTVESHHFEALFDDDLGKWCQNNPTVVLRWIEAIFFYFRAMSAIPEIARAIWDQAARIVYIFRSRELESLMASFQLASWDYFYGKSHHPQYLDMIKALPLRERKAKAYRSLFNTTAINTDQEDYLEHVRIAYEEKDLLGGVNHATCIIHYYCKVDSRDDVLEELRQFFRSHKMRAAISTGNCDFLKPLVGYLCENNDYRNLFILMRSLKGEDSEEFLHSSHGFLLSNASELIVVSPSGRDRFKSQNNYDSYMSLIRTLNKSTNTATSLLGELTEETDYFDESRRGAPPIEDDLERLMERTAEHFELRDPLYDQLNSVTLVPSHGFPIQSALFRLNKSSPVISVSLEDIIDDPVKKHFIFFLSSHTSTCNVERDFILREFGDDADIVIDPTVDVFLSKLAVQKYNVIYVSAHGEYDHWDTGVADGVYFSDDAWIPYQALSSCIPPEGFKRNVILNICNGATTEISCNPYNRGIAASMARGNQTVISHLWPVSTVYACTFGILLLHAMRSKTAMEGAKFVFDLLDNEDDLIVERLQTLSPSMEVLQAYLHGKNVNMRSFKNTGSIAVYS